MLTPKIEVLKTQIERAEANGSTFKARWLYCKLLWTTCQLVIQDILEEIKQSVKNEQD
jgi:hypothetical protein